MTLAILLYVYIALLAFFIIFAIINVLHITFSTNNRASFWCTTIFIAAFVIIISGSFMMMEKVNWKKPLLPKYNATPSLYLQ